MLWRGTRTRDRDVCTLRRTKRERTWSTIIVITAVSNLSYSKSSYLIQCSPKTVGNWLICHLKRECRTFAKCRNVKNKWNKQFWLHLKNIFPKRTSGDIRNAYFSVNGMKSIVFLNGVREEWMYPRTCHVQKCNLCRQNVILAAQTLCIRRWEWRLTIHDFLDYYYLVKCKYSAEKAFSTCTIWQQSSLHHPS